MKHPRHTQAALQTLAMKQRITPDLVYGVSMGLLAHFDACKRGQGDTFGANVITMHILICMLLGNMLHDRSMYNAADEAYRAFDKACQRPDPVSLTTGEYTAIRKCLGPYVGKILPRLEMKQYLSAEARAFEILKVSDESQQVLIQHRRSTTTPTVGESK